MWIFHEMEVNRNVRLLVLIQSGNNMYVSSHKPLRKHLCLHFQSDNYKAHSVKWQLVATRRWLNGQLTDRRVSEAVINGRSVSGLSWSMRHVRSIHRCVSRKATYFSTTVPSVPCFHPRYRAPACPHRGLIIMFSVSRSFGNTEDK